MTTKLKSFCRTIFMCDNPTKGVMFGVSLLLLHSWLTPIYGFYCFSLWAAKDKGSLAVLAPIWGIIALYCLIIILSNTIRLVIRYSTNRFFCVIWAIISCISAPLFTLLLLIQYIKERRVYWAVLAGVTTLSFVVLLLNSGLIQYAIIFTLLQIATVAGTNKEAKFSWLFVYPLVAIGLTWGSLYLYQGVLRDRNTEQRVNLGALVGRSITLEDYNRRSAEGVSLDSEPFKSLIENFASYDYEEDAQPSDKAIEALNQLLELPVGKYAHESKTPLEILEGEGKPELPAFRKSARYLSDKIIANPSDKVIVQECNSGLAKLRDWMLNSSNTLFDTLLAKSFDGMRIEALSYALATGEYTQAEFNQLLNSPVDWRKAFALTLADEAVYMGFMYDSFINGDFPVEELSGIESLKVILPTHFNVYMLKDYNVMLSYLPKLIESLESNQAVVYEPKDNAYIISMMVLPSLERLRDMNLNNEDILAMAQISADIMEQYKLTGELPTTVELPLAPSGKAILYQYGDIEHYNGDFYGFQLSTDDGYRWPCSYNVRLTKE